MAKAITTARIGRGQKPKSSCFFAGMSDVSGVKVKTLPWPGELLYRLKIINNPGSLIKGQGEHQ
jgi:hypothetical protein